MGATDLFAVQFTIPAGTTAANPVRKLLFDERAAIHRMEVRVPPGPSGLAGFRFDHSAEQVIPKVAGTWVVTDDEALSWELDDMSPWPDWHVVGYNTDVYDHTIFVRVFVDLRVPAQPRTLVLQPIE